MPYTILTHQTITTILAAYAIKDLQSFKILSGGSENTNYLLHTEKGKFVLTVCEQKSPAQARELADLLRHLETHSFKSSQITSTANNESAFLWEGKPILLKSFLEGKIIEDLPLHLIELIGQELGKLHNIPPPDYLPKQLSYGQEHFEEVAEYAPNSDFYKWLLGKRDLLIPYLELDLPKTLIHSDVFCDNVIISEDESEATIMDFEEAAYYYRIFDIGMTVIGICGEKKQINRDKMSALLKGYQQVITLTENEQKALPTFTMYAAASMTFWRHKNYHFTNPDPTKFDHYLRLKVLADDVTNGL